MLTLDQLVTPVTEDEALQTILGNLSALGFQATSWQKGSIQLTILRVFAKVYAALATTIGAIAAGGFTSLSSGNWLTLLARYVYSLERLAPQATIGQILLTTSAGAPILTFAAGDLIIADQPNGTSGANTYTCTGGGTIGPSSTLSVEFKADVAGSAANIAPGTTLYLWTPQVGITVSNPLVLPSNTWITTPGADEEDDTRLIARCLGRWAKLTYSNIDGAYIGWALDALPALTRAQMLSAPGDGTVTLVGATALGPIDAGQISTIQDYVNGITDGVGRRPMNDIFSATAATVVTTPALNITVYCLPDTVGTVPGAMVAALLAYIGKVKLGGDRLTGTQGRVFFHGPKSLNATAEAIPGVVNLTWSISGDVLLSPGQIYQPTITVTPVAVSPVV